MTIFMGNYNLTAKFQREHVTASGYAERERSSKNPHADHAHGIIYISSSW